MAGIKPLDMAGNYNVGIGWELNRWLHSTIPPTFQIISANSLPYILLDREPFWY
jgi:hypothetical protein